MKLLPNEFSLVTIAEGEGGLGDVTVAGLWWLSLLPPSSPPSLPLSFFTMASVLKWITSGFKSTTCLQSS